ncbi:MAG TPA: hypothetical protein VF702_11800 [Allosphingosinicella sp.]|jgi:hypothetical protein
MIVRTHAVRRAAALLALAACFAPAAPAAASDVAELACPAEQLTDADRSALDVAAVDSNYERPEVVTIIERVLDVCTARYTWSDEERDDALLFVRATAGQSLFRRQLAGQRHLDVAALERAVIADTALIQAAVERRNSPDELGHFLKRIEPQIRRWARRNGRNDVLLNALGGLFATTAIVEGSRIRFESRDPNVPADPSRTI